jgi:hypothetical protein
MERDFAFTANHTFPTESLFLAISSPECGNARKRWPALARRAGAAWLRGALAAKAGHMNAAAARVHGLKSN